MFRAHLSGTILRDAELRYVNGDPVINFIVAYTDARSRLDGQPGKTVWVSCSYWGDHADMLPMLKAGTLVHLEGSPGSKLLTKTSGEYASILTLKVYWVHFPNIDHQSIRQLKGEPPMASY